MSPEIYHVLIIAALVLIFYFLLKPKTQDPNKSCQDDFELLKTEILACKSLKECKTAERKIECFWDNYYRIAQPEVLKQHYSTLLRELTYIKDYIKYGKGPAYV